MNYRARTFIGENISNEFEYLEEKLLNKTQFEWKIGPKIRHSKKRNLPIIETHPPQEIETTSK